MAAAEKKMLIHFFLASRLIKNVNFPKIQVGTFSYKSINVIKNKKIHSFLQKNNYSTKMISLSLNSSPQASIIKDKKTSYHEFSDGRRATSVFTLIPCEFPCNRYINTIKSLAKLSDASMSADQLQEALSKWEAISKEQVKRMQEAESTRTFWEGSGKIVEQFRSPERRMIRESRAHHISLLNSSRFSSHWFILLTDVFIHITGTAYTAHLLPLLWVELLPDSDTLQVRAKLRNRDNGKGL